MLFIKFGNLEDIEMDRNIVFHPSAFFNTMFEDEWLEDELIVRAIREIEQIPVNIGTVKKDLIANDITPTMLSGGFKALCVAKYIEDVAIPCSRFGENVIPFILELSEKQDIYLIGDIALDTKGCVFPKQGIRVINDGSLLESIGQLYDWDLKAEEEFFYREGRLLPIVPSRSEGGNEPATINKINLN